MTFYIFYGHRVCRVEFVDLIFSLHSWWEGFGSSSLATLPLGLNCGFISTFACGSSTGVCSWGCPGGLGFALWGPRVELMQLLGSQGFWQHQVLRGVSSYGSRKESTLEGYRKQYWPIHSSILAWRTPLTEVWQATGYRVAKSWIPPKQPCAHRRKIFFCLWQLCSSESWVWRWCSCLAWGDPGSAKCAGTRTASAAGVNALSESFFPGSCSWWSEGLFGQSFSVVPPIRALRQLPCLGSFSVVLHMGTERGPLAGVLLPRSVCQVLKGAPWVGVLLCSPVPQAFDRPASLVFSCRC